MSWRSAVRADVASFTEPHCSLSTMVRGVLKAKDAILTRVFEHSSSGSGTGACRSASQARADEVQADEEMASLFLLQHSQ